MSTSSPDAKTDASHGRSQAGAPNDSLPRAESNNASRKRNAFSELMAPKPKQQKIASEVVHSNQKSRFHPTLSGLLLYITKPETFPPGTIVRQTEHTVLIRDLYPKALVHLLLLPRNPEFYNLTPFEAFNPHTDKNVEFLELMKQEANSAAKLAASELSRLVSPSSETDKARREAMDAEPPLRELPAGRDFLPDIKIGVHAHPSMNTLHIHIISVDNHSTFMKHKKHYNSFNTNFLIPLDDFPLMEEDNLMNSEEQESLLKGDMKCWRCGKNFGSKFKQLKDHLDDEYEEWRTI